jgi:Fe-S-cluster containining protein
MMKKHIEKLENDIFVCKQCGHCCHGETTVSLDENDLDRMVKYLKLPEAEVRQKYLRLTDGVVQMKIVDGHCIFFKKGCTVHPGKPWRCSQWPLHPSILQDKSNLEAIKDSCPGISTKIDYEEFCRKFTELLELDES